MLSQVVDPPLLSIAVPDGRMEWRIIGIEWIAFRAQITTRQLIAHCRWFFFCYWRQRRRYCIVITWQYWISNNWFNHSRTHTQCAWVTSCHFRDRPNANIYQLTRNDMIGRQSDKSEQNEEKLKNKQMNCNNKFRQWQWRWINAIVGSVEIATDNKYIDALIDIIITIRNASS